MINDNNPVAIKLLKSVIKLLENTEEWKIESKVLDSCLHIPTGIVVYIVSHERNGLCSQTSTVDIKLSENEIISLYNVPENLLQYISSLCGKIATKSSNELEFFNIEYVRIDEGDRVKHIMDKMESHLGSSR